VKLFRAAGRAAIQAVGLGGKRAAEEIHARSLCIESFLEQFGLLLVGSC